MGPFPWTHLQDAEEIRQSFYHYSMIQRSELNFPFLAKTCHKSSSGKSLYQFTVSGKHIWHMI